MKDPVVRFVVKYPEISSVITKETDDAYHPHEPNVIRAETWDKAHEFLQRRAVRRINDASEEMNRAIAHLNEVMALRNPDQD